MAAKLRGATVVVTGASSGIGRETARAFAAKGANVVVAARRAEPLREVAAECEGLGVGALAVPTDVTDAAAVEELARRATARFGRIDVWVNNAAVGLFARFEEAPLDDYRRVIETNLFGYVYGARAVLPIFRRQGSGVLVNVASMLGRTSGPYVSAYVASKHAIQGLGMSLRQELALDKAKDIHVCTVMPATIDTPFFGHAANYTGRAVKAMPPVYPVERVAERIVRLAKRPRREVFVGNSGRLLQLQFFLAPGLAEKQAAAMVDKLHLAQDQAAPATSGNLFAPTPEGTTAGGGWKSGGSSLPRAAGVGLAAALPAVLLWRRLRTGPVASNPGGNGTAKAATKPSVTTRIPARRAAVVVPERPGRRPQWLVLARPSRRAAKT